MKKAFKLLLFTFLLGLFTLEVTTITNVYAITWQKYPNNPILTGRGGGNWEGLAALNPWVIKKDNQYKLWYEGNSGQGYRIGYASSQDGISNWFVSSSEVIPVGTPDGWEKETRNPSVMFDSSDNIYKMWYTSMNSDHWFYGSDRFRVRYATSLDGEHWTPRSGWIMSGTQGKWDEGGISRGISVLKINGTYKMWYAGTNTNNEGTNPYWRIGYATSSDGINWTKQNNSNPIIEVTEPWEDQNLIAPYVVFENGLYKMWYTTSISDWPHQIVYATSFDGIHWEKPANMNPVISPTPNSFDSFYLGSPSILLDDGVYKMWYTGQDLQRVSIGLATADSSSSLPVPLLKQTAAPWGTDVYDSANEWNPQHPTIGDWGCALTSAAMVLQYHGITNMPSDNTPLDPRTLNNWLKSQPDGYFTDKDGTKTGYINWYAIPRLTKQAHLSNSNPNFAYDALMFTRSDTTDKTILTDDLSRGIPDILDETNHFIVATGTQGSSYTINDPYYSRTVLTDGYNNTFQALDRYTPSHTDLSYIVLTTSPNISISLKDSDNNELGESYIQQPITNETTNEPSGDPLKIVNTATPSAGIYHIDVSSSSSAPFNLQAYLYDINGNVKMASFSGTVSPDTHDDIVLNFNKEDATQSTIQTISFASTIQDVKYYQNSKELTFGLGQAFIALLQSAQKDSITGKTSIAKIKLDVIVNLLNILNTFRGKGISESAYQILLLDLKYLQSHA